jgi:hypothetical protein
MINALIMNCRERDYFFGDEKMEGDYLMKVPRGR